MQGRKAGAPNAGGGKARGSAEGKETDPKVRSLGEGASVASVGTGQ